MKIISDHSVEPNGTSIRETNQRLAKTSGRREIQFKNILVPLDLSDASLCALDHAASMAKQFGAKLTLLHVIEPQPSAPDVAYFGPLDAAYCGSIEEKIEEIREKHIPADVPVEVAVCTDLICGGIFKTAREMRADLIVTTTHGRTGLKRFLLGSTAESIVRNAPCPVLVVRDCDYEGE